MVQITKGSSWKEKLFEGGGAHDPVAVRTTLGWVLSGPVQGKIINSTRISVNFVHVSEQDKNGINSQVIRLWDLDYSRNQAGGGHSGNLFLIILLL